jgi:hypothetical protein
MSQINPSVQWLCDRGDGVTSDAVPTGTVPEGWLTGLGIHVAGSFQMINDLCPTCAALAVTSAIVPAE